jgi:hypothetical protein
MQAELRKTGYQVNRKRVQRLMGLEALGPKPQFMIAGFFGTAGGVIAGIFVAVWIDAI